MSNGQTIKISRYGEDPHAIMIPYDFKYPLEKVCIKNAYGEFNNWGMNKVESTDWYTKPITENVWN
jgi:LruC domain-containing protein